MFKNKVGRPTNKSVLIKKIMYVVIIVLTGIVIFNTIFLFTSLNQLSKLKAAAATKNKYVISYFHRNEAGFYIYNSGKIYAKKYKLKRYFQNESFKIIKEGSFTSKKNKTSFSFQLKNLYPDNYYDLIIYYSNGESEVASFRTEPDYYVNYYSGMKNVLGSMPITRVNANEKLYLAANQFYIKDYDFNGWKAVRRSDKYIYGLKKNEKVSISNQAGWYKKPGKILLIKDRSSFEYSDYFIKTKCKSSMVGACDILDLYATWKR